MLDRTTHQVSCICAECRAARAPAYEAKKRAWDAAVLEHGLTVFDFTKPDRATRTINGDQYRGGGAYLHHNNADTEGSGL